MKINGSESGFFKKDRIDKTGKTDRADSSSAAESGRSSSASGSADEKIVVSDLGKEVARIHEQLKKTPDVRVEKVQELKEKIDDGTYYVGSDQIAQKILEDIISRG